MTRGIVCLAARSGAPLLLVSRKGTPFGLRHLRRRSASPSYPRDTDRVSRQDSPDSHPRHRVITLSVTLLRYLRNPAKWNCICGQPAISERLYRPRTNSFSLVLFLSRCVIKMSLADTVTRKLISMIMLMPLDLNLVTT